MNPSISIVIPVFNEEGNIARLHGEVVTACDRLYDEGRIERYEIIIVNDGSTDRTADVCRNLRPIKLIQMRKNFGQTAAMDAGIKASTGDYIITMDGDAQNDPADIPNLMNYLMEKIWI